MNGRKQTTSADPWAAAGSSEFQRFCDGVASALGVDPRMVPRIASFLATIRRLPLVWFQFGAIADCRDAFARCTNPWAGELVFAQLPNASGGVRSTELSTGILRHVAGALRSCSGQYLCVVEGAPPPAVQAIPGVGRLLQIAGDVCAQARAILYVGPAAAALNVAMAQAAATPALHDVMGLPAVSVPGSPPTAIAFAATLVTHLLGGGPSLEPTRTPPPSLRVVRH